MSGFAKAVIAAIVVLVVLAGVFYTVQASVNETVRPDCVVTDKDRTRDRDGNTDTRVYTKNCGTFTVSDSLLKGQFDSADTFGALEQGKTYDLTTTGFRVGVFSMFPNIIEVSEAK